MLAAVTFGVFSWASLWMAQCKTGTLNEDSRRSLFLAEVFPLYIAWSTAITSFGVEVLPDAGHSICCRPGVVRAPKLSLLDIEDARVYVVTGPRMYKSARR